ncbi:MAG: nucleoside 2-deoxyribosyltransferase [Desulfotalea sp.]
MKKKILLVGNVLIDIYQLQDDIEKRLRFGGITHAARALWCIDSEYHAAYIAPSYIEQDINKYLSHHGCVKATCIGEIFGCPNTILIGDATEAGDQGYDIFLRDHKTVTLDNDALKRLLHEGNFTDILYFPDTTDPTDLLDTLNNQEGIKLHVDLNYQPDFLSTNGNSQNYQIESLFLSTSSTFFYPEYLGIKEITNKTLSACKELVLKENRGGTRVFNKDNNTPLNIPCFPRKTRHSVGVGDTFDAVYISLKKEGSDELALRKASLIAACYAATTYVDDLKADVQRHLLITPEELLEMKGIQLPWEDRENKHLYIAAPDFDYVPKEELDNLIDCLKYHNFSPRLPVRENGQANPTFSQLEKRNTFCADMKIMDECSAMIAVLLYNDQGTLVEIGMAKEKGIPVIVFDPRKILDNLFLEMTADKITSTATQTIEAVFSLLGKQK